MRYITTHENPLVGMLGITDRTWAERGSCYGMDAAAADEIFFPTVTKTKSTEEAKAICASCPVVQQCFDGAMDGDARRGFRAGLTEAERRPFHNKVAKRLDYSRVHAIFRGRDVALSIPERNAVVRQAYLRGWSVERLVMLLQSEFDYTRRLMREQAELVTDRDREWLRQMSRAREAGDPARASTAPTTDAAAACGPELRTAFGEAA
ncbi:WhiB family transcriptional regulator [Streptomyces sp. NBC_01298]|uniref:WhiB family transcriptional regulator n=1 Tax=Streptomyces sp. NBC_01298 TaxID=2903817 RepID=UPI002E142ED6|nr:WhiB family transcriptional regulator [Streptomyces sp. NBC_01298]